VCLCTQDRDFAAQEKGRHCPVTLPDLILTQTGDRRENPPRQAQARDTRACTVKNDTVSQKGKTTAQITGKLRFKGDVMQQHWARIHLVMRTIGARRGRAARGRPAGI